MKTPLERGSVIAVTSVRVDEALDRVDFPALRRRISELFDSAARTVHAMGLDLDDVVVDRLVACSVDDGEEWGIPAECVSDRERFIDSVAAHIARQAGKPIPPALIRIRALTAQVRRS
jgi:hypothetical protein